MSGTKSPFADAWNLEGRLYWDRDIFETEIEMLFSKMWLCVARCEDIAEPGDFVAREIGPDSVLLIRGRDGQARAFFNVCRHRGTRLLTEQRGCNLKSIVCPYHAWVYSAEGSLLAAPHMDSLDDFRREDFPLLRVRMEEWQGFLFVNLDEEAPRLSQAFADFPDVSGYGLGSLRRAATLSYEVEANWKILCENYSECYHCAGVHPHLHRLSDGKGPRASVGGVCFNGGPMSLNDGFASLTLSGSSPRQPLPGLAAEERRLVHYYVLYPNLLLSLHPDYAMTHVVSPVESGRTEVQCDFFFAADEMEKESFDASDAVDFWDLTNRQDWQLCETVQKGVRSRGHRPGRYQESEDCVYFFDRWYLDRMGLP